MTFIPNDGHFANAFRFFGTAAMLDPQESEENCCATVRRFSMRTTPAALLCNTVDRQRSTDETWLAAADIAGLIRVWRFGREET